jgi:6-phosphogluconolactonase/glucosamine-6-phosphate isomerase/deaminase
MLSFKKTESIPAIAASIAATLIQALQAGKSVLWLVPGGSSIAVAAEVSKQLRGHDLHNLSVTLTDERYGPVDHPDSNWRQLRLAGFDLPGAHLVPVLSGADREATVRQYGYTLAGLLAKNDFKLGLFGIGADGHIAGALPGSPAVTSQDQAVGYDAGPFERITMTPRAIARLDEAVVYTAGASKQPVLDRLEEDLPLEEQPAQILKQVPQTTIFNDYKGEEV